MIRIHKDKVLGIIGLIIAGYFAYQTSILPPSVVQGDPGPKVFPYLGCFLIGIVSVYFVFKKCDGSKQFLSSDEWKRLFKLFGLYVLFFILLWLVGYMIAIPVSLFLISWLFSIDSKIWKIAVYSIGVSALIYLAYIVAMDSVLPTGILWKLF